MRAVIPDLTPDIASFRRQTGADRWDEMWEGELHMPPAPNRSHQNLEGRMYVWLDAQWAEPRGYQVYHQINVASPGGWPNDYRVPDLVLLTPDRFHIDRDEYFEGPPSVVVEIHSPGDEAYEKLDFYARIGVPEVWIVHRDTKEPEIYVLAGETYDRPAADADGWLESPVTGVRMRAEAGPKLAVQMGEREETRTLLPDR